MIKVASFNINGIKARMPRLLEWLEETRPAHHAACLRLDELAPEAALAHA